MRSNPEPEEITVSVNVVFTLRFERDREAGGYVVTCRELLEVAGYGKTLRAARADARREIVFSLEERAAAGQLIPPLNYVPSRRYG